VQDPASPGDEPRRPGLSGGDPRFRADRGEPDPAVASALADYEAGTGSEHAALSALAAARLLVPVVAVRADHLADDFVHGDGRPYAGKDSLSWQPSPAAATGRARRGENATEMAVPVIIGRDGRPALPAFTCMDAVMRWQPDARPVPVPAASVWQSAVDQSPSSGEMCPGSPAAVIVDLAGPVPLPVEGARLAALAAGLPVPRLHEDPDVHAIVAAVAAAWPPGIRVRVGPPPAGADLALELRPADPAAETGVPDELARSFAAEVAQRLGHRAGRGIAVLRAPD
jgi:hypothetical protein